MSTNHAPAGNAAVLRQMADDLASYGQGGGPVLRAIATEIERRDAEIERLRTVIRVGGAMLRAEVVALGGPLRVDLQPCKKGCGEIEDPRFGGFCDGCAP